jgi:hypothetical protein
MIAVPADNRIERAGCDVRFLGTFAIRSFNGLFNGFWKRNRISAGMPAPTDHIHIDHATAPRWAAISSGGLHVSLGAVQSPFFSSTPQKTQVGVGRGMRWKMGCQAQQDSGTAAVVAGSRAVVGAFDEREKIAIPNTTRLVIRMIH